MIIGTNTWVEILCPALPTLNKVNVGIECSTVVGTLPASSMQYTGGTEIYFTVAIAGGHVDLVKFDFSTWAPSKS